MSHRHVVLSLGLVSLLLWGCEEDPYRLVIQPDGSPVDAAAADGEAGVDALFDLWKGEKGCVPDPGGEVCDKKDNDCNGKVDDVAQSKLATDPKNCGQCAWVCTLPYAFPKCEKGQCQVASCAAGHYDVNGTATDGCEYACQVTGGGTEVCDNADNDCDGVIDDGIDTASDPKNCGACGKVCSVQNGTAGCKNSACAVTACNSGYKDNDGLAQNGCEYACPVVPLKSVDDCNGLDDDCDGKSDEDFMSAACGNTKGECKAGAEVCQGGTKICQGGTGPKAELCNGLDDDCDGSTDEDFDKQNDPRTCGGCTACSLPNAVAGCKLGVCTVAACKTGYVDKDGLASTGCEYACTHTGGEICDGQDNDCNGLIDDGVLLTQSICNTLGACAGTQAACQGKQGWVCAYSGDVELQSCLVNKDCGTGHTCVLGVCPGVVASEELSCDGKDGDCDGKADDPWSQAGLSSALGKACNPDPTKQGVCQPTGVYACNSTKDGVACQQTAAGKAATDELCNGLDDDCDGTTDESADDAAGKGVKDAVVRVTGKVGSTSVDAYVYAHEASRPDATATQEGTSATRACSKKGALPWNQVTYAVAASACKAAGARLCTAAEWSLACAGASGTTYPYGSTFSKTACNGLEAGYAKPLATGTLSTCQGASTGLYDLSGNLREWTTDKSGTTSGGKAIYVVRGGAYHTPAPGLSCAFTLSQAVEDVILPSVGFRCCKNAP